MEKTIERIAKQIAVWYSCLIDRYDDFANGKKIVLVSIADEMGFEVHVHGKNVMLKSRDCSLVVYS